MFRFFLTAFAPGLALAEEVTSPGVPGSAYLQAIFALILIVALLLATTWFARKLSGGKGFGQGGMKVIGGVALGPRERVVLIEAGEHWLVIGIVPGQIRTLHTMPRGTLPESGTIAGPEHSFAHWLKTVSERHKS